ncbi:MAG: hypothetical protein PHQ43_00195 [Dehalococcoidales bacterium]|nr:hypothetical protein [Dehalococcoidales bacterium]
MATDQAVLEIIIRARDEAKKELEESNKSLTSNIRHLRSNWMLLVGSVGMATGAAMVAINAANKHTASLNSLRVSLRNVGLDYADLKNEIEGVIASQQYQTGISDEEQRTSLSNLLMVTGDLTTAEQLLNEVNMLVSSGLMDQKNAVNLVTQAYQGNADMLREVMGPAYDEAKTPMENLGTYLETVRENTDKASTSFANLKNSFNDLSTTIGNTIEPVLTPLFDRLAERISELADVKKRLGAMKEELQTWLVEPFTFAFSAIGDAIWDLWVWEIEVFQGMVNSLKGFVEPIGDAVTAIGDKIKEVFHGAFNAVIIGINGMIKAIREFSWHYEGWVLHTWLGSQTLIPGFDFSPFSWLPDIKLPEFYSGGMVPGPVGMPQLVVAHGGERFSGVGRDEPTVINLYVGQEKLDTLIVNSLTRKARLQRAFA